MLIFAVHASVHFHNFVMSMENLSYAAYEYAEMQFQEYF